MAENIINFKEWDFIKDVWANMIQYSKPDNTPAMLIQDKRMFEQVPLVFKGAELESKDVYNWCGLKLRYAPNILEVNKP